MLKKVSMRETERILRDGGKVEKNARGQLLVMEKYTRETHPQYFIGCKPSYIETYIVKGYITPICYKKVLNIIGA